MDLSNMSKYLSKTPTYILGPSKIMSLLSYPAKKKAKSFQNIHIFTTSIFLTFS